jgi:phosphoenolpyruvate carboxylase
MELTTEKQIKTLYDYLKYLDYNNDLDFEICDYITEEEAKEIEEVTDILEDNLAFNIEIIYYYKAMRYLLDNDTSLSESINIALEYGYTLENINSELLASLLASQEARNKYYELETQINDFINNLK